MKPRGRAMVCLVVGDDAIRVVGTEGSARLAWPAQGAADPEQHLARELASALERHRRPLVSVVLLPSMVDLRRIGLPGVRASEIGAVLENHGSRYFPRRMAEPAIGWLDLERGRERRTILAAAADATRLEMLLDALASVRGAAPVAIPAHVVWVEAAKRSGCVGAKADALVCVEIEGGWLALTVQGGRLVKSTAFGEDSRNPLSERLGVELRKGGQVAILGSGALADRLATESRAEVPHPPARLEEDPEVLAVRFAAGCSGPAVLPARIATRRRQKHRRAQLGRAAVAAALIVSAVGLNSWRMARDLGAIREERAAHAAEVEELLGLRDRLGEIDDWIVGARQQAAIAASWSVPITRLAHALPDGVQFDRVAGRASAIEITGSAPSAGDVLAAVQPLPGVASVELSGPVRRVGRTDGSSEEQFSLIVRLTGAWRP